MECRTAIRQVDVVRALKGARAAGLNVARLEITSQGTMVLVFLGAAGDASLDDWLRDYARKTEGNKQRKKEVG
jgi:hypothetical protein